jgi:DNA-binding IclR family transcriptional regulator
MPTTTGDSGFSQSLERGLAVLAAFTPDRPTLGISELARRLDLTRSTTHRYVATLAALGYLQQDEPTRQYRLGPRVLDLGFSVLGSLELREIAAPHLRRLTDTTGHTSNLAIRDDTDVILIDPAHDPARSSPRSTSPSRGPQWRSPTWSASTPRPCRRPRARSPPASSEAIFSSERAVAACRRDA